MDKFHFINARFFYEMTSQNSPLIKTGSSEEKQEKEMSSPCGAISPSPSEESQVELKEALKELEVHEACSKDKHSVSYPTLVEPEGELEDKTFDLRNCTLARMRVTPPPDQPGKRKSGM